MHDEPHADATDPSDLTQRHTAPPVDPAPAVDPGAPISPVDPVTSYTSSDPERVPGSWTPTSDRYTPAPETRSDWARSWDDAPPVTPERWYEPAPTPAATAVPTSTTRGDRRGGGSLLAAALLSAVLASGGTVLALNAAGALDRPVAAVTAPQSHQRRRPPAGRHRRIVGDHRRRGQGQPGRRQDPRHRRERHRQPRGHPADRCRLGGHLQQQRLDPDQPSRRRGWREVRRRAQGRPDPVRHGLRHRHADRPGHRQGRRHGPADRRDRQVGRAQGRPARDRHRQPARHLLELGHQRDRVGQGPLDHDRQQRSAVEPHPDRRRDQPG